MRNTSLLRRTLAAASLAAALWACERSEPPPGPAPSEAPAPAAPAEQPAITAEPAASDVVVIPPFDPSLPALKLEPPPISEAQPPEVPRAKPKIPTQSRAERSAPTTAKAEPDHPPLDALFRTRYEPQRESTTVDLAPGAPDPPPTGPKPPRALDRLGDSIRLERRGEAIGPPGPRQGTAWETEAGLRIPVDKSVSLEGGVRLDSREEPGAKAEPTRKTPRVGVQVRF